MGVINLKDAVDYSRELFNGNDSIGRINRVLTIVAFLLAMINLFGLQKWIDIDTSNISLCQQFKSLSGACFAFLCIFIVLHSISVLYRYAKWITFLDVFESIVWILVDGKLINDFVNRPGVSISCNLNFLVYLITIAWFLIGQITKHYRFNNWMINSIYAESSYYDINGEGIYEGDIVKYCNRLYVVTKIDSTQNSVSEFKLEKLNLKKYEIRSLTDLADVVNNDDYDLEILKKRNWNNRV